MVNNGDRPGILKTIDNRTKVLALIALVAEALFLGSLAKLPAQHTIWALLVCAMILVISIVGIVVIERAEANAGAGKGTGLIPSPLTPDSPILNDLVNSAIQAVCRAVSLPQTPESAGLRAFIFRRDGDSLVCSHYWAPNPVKELVGRLRFRVTAEIATRVAVVRAVIDQKICRTKVADLPDEIEGVQGEVTDNLSFVLAAPILTKTGDVWGTVDFDATNDVGEALLATEISDAAMYQLAQHLQIIFNLTSPADLVFAGG